MSETLDLEIVNAIATVTLKGTTMPPPFFADIRSTFGELNQRPDLRAVVIRGSGKVFSYGLDLPAAFAEHGKLFKAGPAPQRAQLLALIAELQQAFNAVEACPVPVIAAIHGWCIGGGLDLISACDIRVASADTKISLGETRVAIVADLGSLQRLPRIIGAGHAKQMAFTGREIDAERAQRIGLVNDVYESREVTAGAAQQLAEEISGNAPLTVRGVKQVMQYSADKSVADGLAYVAAWNSAFLPSEDLGEAVSAFVGKRPPKFQGR